ncbi:hypothetical protein DQM09_05700 [Leuconostoc mesenteroides subsp. mesenteroides]|nr:hypothetical protein [Leuconostoc mesenteroides]MBZ1502369.1 hypothetical protein [Leuconostoc mesenteroides]RDF91963.1 hypothetical protein DQM09_05700 [Leuconostoc mesenteroides subsp. mesenteroides]GEP15626.1 hypothetical protein LME05_03620 [Leuconostoc mesenteroides subsp. cremoris]
MAIQFNNFAGGYSTDNYTSSPLSRQNPILLLGTGLKQIPQFENNRPIPNTVERTQIEVYYSGLGTVKLSLPAGYKLPSIDDLSSIELLSPEAFINSRNQQIYLRAQGVKANAK